MTHNYMSHWASQVALEIKHPPASAGEEMRVRSLGGEEPLEEGVATHSSILGESWRILEKRPMGRGTW